MLRCIASFARRGNPKTCSSPLTCLPSLTHLTAISGHRRLPPHSYTQCIWFHGSAHCLVPPFPESPGFSMCPLPSAQGLHQHLRAKEPEQEETTDRERLRPGLWLWGRAACSFPHNQQDEGLWTPRSKDGFVLLWQGGCFDLKINSQTI